MILIFVTMLVNGCYGKVDCSTGWSQWFDDHQAAWPSGEAVQLMFQEHYPTPKWGVDDGYVQSESPSAQDELLLESDLSECECEWNPDLPDTSETTSVRRLGDMFVSFVLLLLDPFRYAISITKKVGR